MKTLKAFCYFLPIIIGLLIIVIIDLNFIIIGSTQDKLRTFSHTDINILYCIKKI